MLKLENLRTFVTVANAGNIAGAAAVLGRTPSAVSMALKALETEIGGALFETDRKNVLTALGQYTREVGRTQIAGYDGAVRGIRAFADNAIGRLSVAMVPSVATNLIPDILPEFLANRPGVDVEMLDADSRAVAALVDAGQCELGIAGMPANAARVEFTPLFADRFRVVFEANSGLGDFSRALTWKDLRAERFIRNEAADRIDLPELRQQYFEAKLVVRNVSSLLALVATGMGVTLLPALATSRLPEGVAARDVDFRGAERIVGLITRQGPAASPVATAFAAHIRASIPKRAARLGLVAITDQAPSKR